jgi:hypothetical protein
MEINTFVRKCLEEMMEIAAFGRQQIAHSGEFVLLFAKYGLCGLQKIYVFCAVLMIHLDCGVFH